MQTYLALVPRPLEQTCLEELVQIGVHEPKVLQGAVAFEGSLETLYRVNLWSRCAMRILVRLDDFPCQTADDLYDRARNLPWEQWLHKDTTFAIRFQGQTPQLTHSLYASQRLKDALVDRFRDNVGTRPNVEPSDPIMQIHAQLYQENSQFRCAISLDSSGIPLSNRGYRRLSSQAPLKENLAAAILRLCQVHTLPLDTPLVDPFCGSGTFPIEAALMKLNWAPGLHRPFAFERWPDWEPKVWNQLKEEALSQKRTEPDFPICFGSDQDATMIRAAKQHAVWAGLTRSIDFQPQPIQTMTPPTQAKGLLVCNPPYGNRIGDEESLTPTYRALGDTLKREFSGWQAYVFTANLPLGRQIGLRPHKRLQVYNGPLEGRLLHFSLY